MSLDVCLKHQPEEEYFFTLNITHNLVRMAKEAGVYQHLWRPEEIGITKAGELVEPLSVALRVMVADPGRFMQFNPKNGWGDYDGLLDFIKQYLVECICYPDAIIEISR